MSTEEETTGAAPRARTVPPRPAPIATGAAVPWLLLWDIDGTLLLRASASHAAAVWDALREVHGLEDRTLLRKQPMAGMTDGQIARDILSAAGVDPAQIDRHAPTVLERVCSTYVPGDLETHISPGLEDALHELAGRGDVVHSLVTGNFERVARLKLRAAGLAGWFDPRVGGGFGSDHEDRAFLPATARRRAGEALLPDGRPWPADRAIVIGDTPRDVACARHDGVRVIGVSTGSHGADDLEGADVVVHAASELPAAVAALAGPPGGGRTPGAAA